MTDSVLLPPVVETNTNFATLLGTIDLGYDAKNILLAMLNRASVKQFSFDEYDFSEPVRPVDDTPVRNTLIRLLPKSTSNQYGSTVIYYNRIHISTLGDIRVFKNGATMVSEVIPYINTTYGIYLTELDYVNKPLPASNGTDEVHIDLEIRPACMQFYGGTRIVLALPTEIQVDKAHIGLSNVDNTADVDKPVSTLQAAANVVILQSANVYTDNAINGALNTVNNAAAAAQANTSTNIAAGVVESKSYANNKIADALAAAHADTVATVAAALDTISQSDLALNANTILAQAALTATTKDAASLLAAKAGWEAADLLTLDAAATTAGEKDDIILAAARSFATGADAAVLASANASIQAAISNVTGNIGGIVLAQAKLADDVKLEEARSDWSNDIALARTAISAQIAQSAAQTLTVTSDMDEATFDRAALYSDTKLADALQALDFSAIADGDAIVLASAKAFATSSDSILQSNLTTLISNTATATLNSATTAAETAVAEALADLPTAAENTAEVQAALAAAKLDATTKDNVVLSQVATQIATAKDAANDYTDTTLAAALADVGAPTLAAAAALDDAVLAEANATATTKDTAILAQANAFSTTVGNGARDFATDAITAALATLDSPATVAAAVASGVAEAKAFASQKDADLLILTRSDNTTNLQAAKDYTDVTVALAVSDLETPLLIAAGADATTKDVAILAAAKADATAKDNALHTTITGETTAAVSALSTTVTANLAAGILDAKAYADSAVDSAVFDSNANIFDQVDAKDAVILSNAHTYTDNSISSLHSTITSETTSAVNTASTASGTSTDNKISTASSTITSAYTSAIALGVQQAKDASTPIAHAGAGAGAHALATTSVHGFMSSTDKSKLDGIGASPVTTVSVTTANGVSGTVATPNTTPAITLTLGDITPTSVTTTAGSTASGTSIAANTRKYGGASYLFLPTQSNQPGSVISVPQGVGKMAGFYAVSESALQNGYVAGMQVGSVSGVAPTYTVLYSLCLSSSALTPTGSVPMTINVGSYFPVTFDTSGNSIFGPGSAGLTYAALATGATNGFPYVPTMPGIPSATPTAYTGRAPIVVDSTNGYLYFYSNGAWRSASGPVIKGVPQNIQSGAYTFALSDGDGHVLHPSADTTARTYTIPANSAVAFPIGTALTIVNQNGAGSLNITINTDIMRMAGTGTTATFTLAANGIATALKLTTTEWIISGVGLTST